MKIYRNLMKRFFNFVGTIVLCATAFTVFSCEDDISGVGSGLLDSGSTANVQYVNLIAYNSNNDSIRSDEKVLQSGVLGVYEEPVFGRTKAHFYSQARLSGFNPDFGDNAEMDSVILYVPVYVNDDEDEIEVDTTYLYLGAGEEPSDSATVRIKRTYKLDSIYGNTDLTMNLQVREVSDYMGSQETIHFSNPNLAPCVDCPNTNQINVFPTVLGTGQIKNKVTTYQVKKLNANSTTVPATAFQIKLDKDYFKQKFIDNQNSSDLNDNAAFIRNFFRGIELTVAEDQGFLFNFRSASSDFSLVMYYHYDNPDEQEEGDEDYEETLNGGLPLNFLTFWSDPSFGYNVQVNQFEHINRSSQFVNAYTNPNTTVGDSRLYLAGMDGTKTIIKINQEELNEIRQNVLNNDWAIVGAELNLYVDESQNFRKPPYLFAWNNYRDEDEWKNINFPDVYTFYNSYPVSVQFNPMYDYEADNKMYTIRITDYIKSIVEQNEIFEEGSVILSLGNFLLSPSGSYTTVYNTTDPFYNNRSFNPYRVVLHGSNSENQEKRLKLKVYYTQK